jgi:hypothetical protein
MADLGSTEDLVLKRDVQSLCDIFHIGKNLFSAFAQVMGNRVIYVAMG